MVDRDTFIYLLLSQNRIKFSSQFASNSPNKLSTLAVEVIEAPAISHHQVKLLGPLPKLDQQTRSIYFKIICMRPRILSYINAKSTRVRALEMMLLGDTILAMIISELLHRL
jgi:hypothetical protein